MKILLNKVQRLLLNQDEFYSNCAVDKHSKILMKICILTDIQKVKYQWTDILVNLLYNVNGYFLI